MFFQMIQDARDGALASMAVFALGHPLEVYKLRAQKDPQLKAWQIVKGIPFYTGATVNLGRRVFKEAYRWPTIRLVNQFYKDVLAKHDGNYPVMRPVFTAVTLSGLETGLVLPLERLFIEKVNKEGYRVFFKNNGFFSLYGGFQVALLQKTTSWSVLMVSNHLCKSQWQKWDPEKKYFWPGYFVSNLCVATSMILWCSPFDFMKVRVQMDPELQKMNVYRVVRVLFKQHGLKAMYAGIRFSFAHRLLQAFASAVLIDRVTK